MAPVAGAVWSANPPVSSFARIMAVELDIKTEHGTFAFGCLADLSLGIVLQLVSMSEELRRALYATNSASFDLEILVPDLVGVTEILTEDHRKELCRHLPARAEGEQFFLFILLSVLFSILDCMEH